MMRKFYLVIIVFILILANCNDPVSKNSDKNTDNTFVVFDNSQGISAVIVYSSYTRSEDSKITEVPAGKKSAAIKWYSGTNVSFFFTYIVTLKDINNFVLSFTPDIGYDQIYPRIDANVTTNIPIRSLGETVSSNEQRLTKNSYLFIQNNSSFPIELLRGMTIIPNDNLPGETVNPGERALYTIKHSLSSFVLTSTYMIRVGLNSFPFSGSLVNFESGYVYSYVFDGSRLNLISEIEIILDNVTGTPDNIPVPAAPAAPIVTASDGLLTVMWTAVEKAEKYEVYYSTSAIPPNNPARTIPGTTVVLHGLTNKTTYNIWIKAVNSAGSGAFSSAARGIPWSLNERPAVPRQPVIIPGINQITINWDECGGASSYEVYINTTTVPPSAPAITTTDTSAVVKELENNVIYYFWVRAVNDAGKSDYSLLEAGTPQLPTVVPSVPQPPELTAGSRELIVSWRTTELAASYEVWYGQNNNSNQAQKYGGDITETETVITGLVNETTYYVWIRAKNIIGVSDYSVSSNAAPSAFAVPPVIPAMPNINIGSGSLDVSWLSTEGALVYEIWKGETNNLSTAVKHGTDLSGTFTAITGLTNGTTYYIWIRAKNNTGASGYSPMASGTPSALAAKPLDPQTAPVVIAGSGQLTVSWQAVEGASVYEIWTWTANDSSMAVKQNNDVSILSAVITGLTNGTTYYVWIKAKNNLGASEFSPAASGTPQAYAIAPGSPQAPLITIGNGQLSVSWTAVQGAAAYEIWTATANSSSSATKQGNDINTSTSAIITGLNNGTIYYVWLKAKNSFGISDFSSVSSGKPIANAAVPSLISSNAQITVNWDAIAGADQYDVFIGTGTNPPQTASRTVNTPATSAVFTGLVNGTNYSVWIQGKNATGTGALSNYANAKPIANIGAVSINAGNQRLSINWASVAGADQYEVYHSASNTMPGSPSQTVAGTTATISSLVNGTTYYVWVNAKNQNGGRMSVVASGKPLGTPGAPTLSPGYGQLGVTWTSVAGADEYEVYYGIGTATTLATTVTGNSATITGLTNGTTYHVRLRARNAGGVSEFGASVSSETSNVLNPGLYRNGLKIGEQNLSAAMSWISSNAVSGDEFTIVLGGNESIAPTTLGYSGRTVGITLQGYGVERTVTLSSNGSMFTVNAGVTLTLDENVSLVGRTTNNVGNTFSIININTSGFVFINYGAKLRGNTTQRGGGIYINGGNVVMNGGKIEENTSLYSGGGIYINNGTLIINDGIINRNSVSSEYGSGGGISISAGTVTILGGKISGNHSGGTYGCAGGIYNNGTINMYGGVINGNSARARGGGIYNDYNGNFIMDGGVIYGSEIASNDSDGITLKNTAGTAGGHAITSSTEGISGIRQRNITAWETDHIDTTTGRGLSASGYQPFGE